MSVEFKYKVEGIDKLDKASKAFAEETVKQIQIGLYASGKYIEAEYKRKIMAGGKSGRSYKRRGVLHQASAPGQAPANNTGRLVNSVVTSLDKAANAVIVAVGKGGVKYARLLEFGTRLMAARPALVPAAESSRQWINERLARSMRDAIKKVSKRK